jgi:hypothetical protein
VVVPPRVAQVALEQLVVALVRQRHQQRGVAVGDVPGLIGLHRVEHRGQQVVAVGGRLGRHGHEQGVRAGVISWNPSAVPAFANELGPLVGSVTSSRPRNIDQVFTNESVYKKQNCILNPEADVMALMALKKCYSTRQSSH